MKDFKRESKILLKISFLLFCAIKILCIESIGLPSKLSDDPSLDLERKEMQDIVKNTYRLLFKCESISESEKEIIRNLNVTVYPRWNVNGFSFKDHGRQVRLYAGMHWMFKALADADLLAVEFDEQKFCYDYLLYASGVYLKNTNSDTLSPLATPLTAIRDGILTAQHISSADAINIKFSSAGLSRRSSGIIASAVLVLLHEYGHHINGDMNSVLGTLNERRECEFRADKWGATTMFKLGMFPSQALELFSLFGTADEDTEESMDHPAGQKRVLAILELEKTLLHSELPFAEQLRKDGKLQGEEDYLDSTIERISEAMKALE